MQKHLLLIFVKDPEAGKVKTRLAKDIGQEKALQAYRRLLAHTLEVVRPVQAQKAVYYGNRIPAHDLWAAAQFPRYLQQGETLGQRMEQAFRQGFEQGYRHILIIGSDCAHLSTSILETAFDKLQQYETVLGPATDGGYYLLGMNALFSPVFHHKAWSTDTVLAHTLADLQAAGKTVFLLPTLSDVDTGKDLKGTFLEDLAE
ncbi:MAG: glycosyltransferase [Bacteroidetes bacterium]|nr:MAG: glycosyltransferase [Bacteroidota bacterium]